MDNTSDTLTLPHDLYARIVAYASSQGEAPEEVVAMWLRERLGALGAASDEGAELAELQARLEAIASLDGIVSAPVEREWADQHDLYVSGAGTEDDQ
jgi:hypothetical protein